MIFSWLLVLLIPAFAVYPALLFPVEEHGYDAAVLHVYRGVLFSAARADGVLYPRWLQPLDGGLGGPLFSFYSPLTYFAMDALHTAGLSYPHTWRALVALALLLASTGIFALVLALSGNTAGALAASAVYVYSFPFLRELFERGSPEGFSFALYPWILWGLVRLIQSPSGWRLGFAALSFTVDILTHNLTALILIPMLGLIGLLFAPRYGWRALWAPLSTLGLGLLLSAFFTITFLTQRDFVHLANALVNDYVRIARNPVSWQQLLQLPASYDVGFDNNFIGGALGPLGLLILVTGLAAGFVLLIRATVRRGEPAKACDPGSLSGIAGFSRFPWLNPDDSGWKVVAAFALALIGLMLVWLLTASANRVWEILPLVEYMQMRTRLFGLIILSTGVVAGLLVGRVGERWRTGVAYALVAVAIFLALPVLYPQLEYRYRAFEENPTASDAKAWSLAANVPGFTAFNEFLPIWRRVILTADEARRVDRSLLANLPAGGRILSEERHSDWLEARIESPVTFDAALHVLYYPNWVGSVDGKAHRLEPMGETGYVVVKDVPAGAHTIALRYEASSVESAASWVSLAAAIGLLLTAIRWRGKKAPPSVATYLKPNWGLAAGIVFLVGIKALWVDPQTTLFRQASSCAEVQQGNITSVSVRFDDSLRLCAIDFADRAFRPGDTVKMTLYWETTEARRETAETFVHLLGTAINPATGNPLWGQQDKQLPGLHPVTQWAVGKIYRDTYQFVVAADAPPGEYQIELGWWQSAKGRRLLPELVGSTDKVAVSTFESLLIPGIVVR